MELNVKKHKLENNDIDNQDFINQIRKNIMFSGFVIGYNNIENTSKIISAVNNHKQSNKIQIIDTKLQFDMNVKNTYVTAQTYEKENNESFNKMIKTAMRSSPDVCICGVGKNITDFEPILFLMATGHTVAAMWNQPSVYEAISKYVSSENDIQDFLTSVSYIYAGKSCIADDNLNFIEINEYILLTQTIKEDLYNCPVSDLPNEFKNIMKRNKWTFEDDLRKKYKEGLITEKYYNLYLEELNSAS